VRANPPVRNGASGLKGGSRTLPLKPDRTGGIEKSPSPQGFSELNELKKDEVGIGKRRMKEVQMREEGLIYRSEVKMRDETGLAGKGFIYAKIFTSSRVAERIRGE
jgi:hypothetical protein